MKKFVGVFIALCGVKAFALGDIEKGILFGANAASMGTFLPSMEAEIGKIKLEHQKKSAELQLQFEKDQRASLVKILAEEIENFKKLEKQMVASLNLLASEGQAFSDILNLVEGLYTSKISLQTFMTELADRADTLKAIDPNWVNSTIERLASTKDTGASQDEIRATLYEVLEQKGAFDILLDKADNEITSIRRDIKTLETRMEGL